MKKIFFIVIIINFSIKIVLIYLEIYLLMMRLFNYIEKFN